MFACGKGYLHNPFINAYNPQVCMLSKCIEMKLKGNVNGNGKNIKDYEHYKRISGI